MEFFDQKECGGIKGWYWLKQDTGAWDGPKMDWENHHVRNIKEVCQSFRTVVQAGGNQGMYPKLLSYLFENVYTFEPDPINYSVLEKNCTENNIHKTQCALGNSNEGVSIQYRVNWNTGMNQVKVGGDIPQVRLDELDISEVDLLMFDMEGYEINAFNGAEQTIAKWKPVIFCEYPTQNVHMWMESNGYQLSRMSAMDTIFIPR